MKNTFTTHTSSGVGVGVSASTCVEGRGRGGACVRRRVRATHVRRKTQSSKRSERRGMTSQSRKCDPKRKENDVDENEILNYWLKSAVRWGQSRAPARPKMLPLTFFLDEKKNARRHGWHGGTGHDDAKWTPARRRIARVRVTSRRPHGREWLSTPSRRRVRQRGTRARW